jgi:hypothetical protein
MKAPVSSGKAGAFHFLIVMADEILIMQVHGA